MKIFFSQIPIIIKDFSKGVFKAIKNQLLEIAKVFKKIITYLWLFYQQIEHSILGTIVDIFFLVLALRYLLVLVGIALAFIYFKCWILFFIYATVVFFAIKRFFSMPPKKEEDLSMHLQKRVKFVTYLKWPLRVLPLLIILYISYTSGYFNFFELIEYTKIKEVKKNIENSLIVKRSNNLDHKIEDQNSETEAIQAGKSLDISPPVNSFNPTKTWKNLKSSCRIEDENSETEAFPPGKNLDTPNSIKPLNQMKHQNNQKKSKYSFNQLEEIVNDIDFRVKKTLSEWNYKDLQNEIKNALEKLKLYKNEQPSKKNDIQILQSKLNEDLNRISLKIGEISKRRMNRGTSDNF